MPSARTSGSSPFFPGLLHLFRVAVIAIMAGFCSSCAVHENTRHLGPGVSDSSVSRLKTFYVRKHGDDDYKLGEEIAAQLRQMGYQASVGSTEKPPSRVDAIVTYKDRWTWDITMYLLSLEVQLREPGSDATLLTAKTVRSSLVRKSQQEVVKETLAKLLENP